MDHRVFLFQADITYGRPTRDITRLLTKMATENFEMNGDADRNGETEVRKGNTDAENSSIASCPVILNQR